MRSASLQTLPVALVESDEFRQLNEKQTENFSARLGYVGEVIATTREFLSRSGESEMLTDFLDGLELDTVSANVFSTQLDEHQQNYLVHSSWTFNCAPEVLFQAVKEIPTVVNPAAINTSFAGESAVKEWLGNLIDGMAVALGRFHEAPSYCVAIANLIAMDALLSELLSGVIRSRLNPNLQRPGT